MTASPQEIEQEHGGNARAGRRGARGEGAPEDLLLPGKSSSMSPESVAEAAKGVSPQENQALDSIRAETSVRAVSRNEPW